MKRRSVFILLFSLILFLLTKYLIDKKQGLSHTYLFQYDSTIVLNLPSPKFNLVLAPKLIKTDSSVNLFYYSRSHLFLYNLTKKRLERFMYINDLRYAYFINSDSILIFRGPNHFKYDSCFMLIDINGKIKRVYDFNGAPILTNKNKIKNADSIVFISDYFAFKNNKAYFFVQKLLFDYLNDSLYKKVSYPLFGYLDMQKDSFVFIDKIKQYPFLDTNRLVNKSFGYPFLTIYKNYLLISYRYTPYLQVYDLNKDSVFYKYAGSYFIDTVYLYKDIPAYEDGKGYGPVSYKGTLERLAVVDRKLFTKVILDSNINKIGEYVYSKSLLGKIGDTAYFLDYAMNKKVPGKLFISIGRAKLVTVNKQDFIDRIKDSIKTLQTSEYCGTGLLSGDNLMYPKKLEDILLRLIEDSTFSAVIVPVYHSCHSCVQKVLLQYSSGYPLFKSKNFYLIAIGDNLPAVQGELEHYNLSPINAKKVKLDTIGKYLQIYKNVAMQHFARVENRKLVKYKSYPAPEIDSLIVLMLESIISGQ